MSASILKTILNKQQTTTIYHYLESLHPPFQYVIQVKICVVPHAVDDRNPTVASNRTAQEQCDQIQQNSLWQFLKLFLVYCKILNRIWQIYYALRQFFIVETAKNWKII